MLQSETSVVIQPVRPHASEFPVVSCILIADAWFPQIIYIIPEIETYKTAKFSLFVVSELCTQALHSRSRPVCKYCSLVCLWFYQLRNMVNSNLQWQKNMTFQRFTYFFCHCIVSPDNIDIFIHAYWHFYIFLVMFF